MVNFKGFNLHLEQACFLLLIYYYYCYRQHCKNVMRFCILLPERENLEIERFELTFRFPGGYLAKLQL